MGWFKKKKAKVPKLDTRKYDVTLDHNHYKKTGKTRWVVNPRE